MLEFMLSKAETRKTPTGLYNFDLEPTPPLPAVFCAEHLDRIY